eukprot:7739376-Alexandrium_andersonii.AAC.1
MPATCIRRVLLSRRCAARSMKRMQQSPTSGRRVWLRGCRAIVARTCALLLHGGAQTKIRSRYLSS